MRGLLVWARAGLVAALVITGCGPKPVTHTTLAGQVRVDVTDVAYDHSTDTHYVILGERAGHRELPITIGDDEARSIMFELHGIKPDRPLTYQLVLGLAKQTGNQVERVEISDVHEQVYFAHIFLDKGRVELDSRPSDAIAIALGAHAPIYVADNLFQAAPASSPAPSVRTASALGLTVQELSPGLAEYFGTAAHSGVVIADLSGEAHKAGLSRGDIITQVDGRGVTQPGEFSSEIAAASAAGNSTVALTVTHGNRVRVVTLFAGRSSG